MQQEVSSLYLSQLQEMREEGIFITVWFVFGLFAEATSKWSLYSWYDGYHLQKN